MRLSRSTVVVFCVLFFPALADAQMWSVDAYAGRATYSEVAPALGTTNAVLGLRYASAGGGWFYASAAAPLENGSPFWGAAGLGRRLLTTLGPVGLGIDAAGHGYMFRDPDSVSVGVGGTLAAMPVLTVGGTSARLELRSGVRHSSVAYLGASLSRALHESDARAIVRPLPELELGGELRHARAEEGNYSYAGANAALALGPVDAWGSVGRWLEDALPDMHWSAGARLAVGRRFDVWAGVQQEAVDPLYWNATRRTWNIGVSRSFGGGGQPVLATPAAVPTAAGVTFTVPVSEASDAPAVAGDFNGWQPVPLQRAGDKWVVTLPIPRGTYHFAFRSADGEWFLPSSVVARLDDGFGGQSGLLIVQ
jgi:hypothetical protein